MRLRARLCFRKRTFCGLLSSKHNYIVVCKVGYSLHQTIGPSASFAFQVPLLLLLFRSPCFFCFPKPPASFAFQVPLLLLLFRSPCFFCFSGPPASFAFQNPLLLLLFRSPCFFCFPKPPASFAFQVPLLLHYAA